MEFLKALIQAILFLASAYRDRYFNKVHKILEKLLRRYYWQFLGLLVIPKFHWSETQNR